MKKNVFKNIIELVTNGNYNINVENSNNVKINTGVQIINEEDIEQ